MLQLVRKITVHAGILLCFCLERSWHFDNVTNKLTYLLSANSTSASQISYMFREEPCPISGCPQPSGEEEPLEGYFRYWSNANHWITGRVPGGTVNGRRENVTILSRWKMIIDVSSIEVDRLTILGHLEFGQLDINLTASMVGLHMYWITDIRFSLIACFSVTNPLSPTAHYSDLTAFFFQS